MPSPGFLSLRNVLLLDAITCVAMGVLLTAASLWIGALTQIPAGLLFYAGAVLFPVAAFMALVATRSEIPQAGVRLIVAGNAAWVAGSILLLASGWIAPNALGCAFVLLQALAVAILAWLERIAARHGEIAALSKV
jgi:hypothetical protein